MTHATGKRVALAAPAACARGAGPTPPVAPRRRLLFPRLRGRRLALALMAACSLRTGTQAEHPTAVDPAAWAPPDALAYLGVADTGQLSAAFQDTAFYRMIQEGGEQAAAGQPPLPARIYTRLREYLSRALDAEPQQLGNPFGGPLALYLAPPPGDPTGEPGVVLVAGVGDAGIMREYYGRVLQKFQRLAGSYEKIAAGSYTIDCFAGPAEEQKQRAQDPNAPGVAEWEGGRGDIEALLNALFGRLFSSDGTPQRLALCLTGERLIAAPTAGHVQDVLGRRQGAGTLLESEHHQTLVREFQPLGCVRLLVNLDGLFRRMEREGGAELSQALTMLGARSMRGLVGHVLLGSEAFESKAELLLLLGGRRDGLAHILSMDNAPLTPPASVPLDTVVYASVNADLVAILDELERMIRQIDPHAADELRRATEKIELPGEEPLLLRAELLEKLRPPLVCALRFQPPAGPDAARLSLTAGHRDRQALARVLTRLGSLVPGAAVQRDVRGTTVYDFPGAGVSLALTDATLTGCTGDSSALTASAPAPQPGLADGPLFKALAAHAPREAWGVLFVDRRRLREFAVAMAGQTAALASAPATSPAALLRMGIAQALAAGITPEQIADAPRLSRYQAASLTTLATTPAGIRLTLVRLRPTE